MIEQELKDRILVLDGAMGTMLQAADVRYDVCDRLNISAPDIVENVHRAYIAAGADIIETNSFNLCGYETTLAGAAIARRAADSSERKVYVAGVLGPYAETDMDAAYEENAKALLDGGVDIILIETVFYPANAKKALHTVYRLMEERRVNVPVMVSATINDESGRLLTGTSLEAFYNAIRHFPLMSFGLNCSFGADKMIPFIAKLSEFAECGISMHPNAGLPNEAGEYDHSPEMMARTIGGAAKQGFLNIAGGCCGTTPAHIKAISESVKGLKPRIPVKKEGSILTVSGLDTVDIDLDNVNFVNVGERTNVAGSRKFARLIAEKNYSQAADIARKQVEDGANVIDINMDDALLDSAHEMETFIKFIQDDPAIARSAIMIDSSDWDTVVAGLKAAPGRCIVNSISLRNGEDEFVRKAREIKRFGAAVIVMAFDEKGQATDFRSKTAICSRAFELLTSKVGLRPCDIIFDVNVLTIGTGMDNDSNYAVDFIEAVRWIKQNLKGCHTSGGISNLSFAFRGNNSVREAMHTVFLYHAISAGLDMAIVNPSMLRNYDELDSGLRSAVEDVILNRDSQATARLLQLAGTFKDTASSDGPKKKSWRGLPCEERLIYSLCNGIEEYLAADLAENLESRNAVQIIDGPLLQGMEKVGHLFSEGKMFLPQVVKAARTMRSAVDILQPEIEKSRLSSLRKRKKMILATVKGDVHDIGKNILGIVLSCNDIDIIDLGVMVENSVIIDSIRREDADIVGVSGLISPSLKEMENLCADMEKAGCSIPLFVGGATTSALHTALKLAPGYSGGVVYTDSASDCANMVAHYLHNPSGCLASVREQQKELVNIYQSSKERFVTLEEARAKAAAYTDFSQAEGFGKTDILDKWIDPLTVASRINWDMFLSFWGIKDIGSDEGRKMLDKGNSVLREMSAKHNVEVSCIARFFDAHRENEDILLGQERFGMGRSTSSLTQYESLADFLPENGFAKAGLFAVKVEDFEESCHDCKDFNHLLRHSVCIRLAEAAAQWLQERVACGSNVIRPAFGYASCPDHSLKAKALEMLDAEKELGIRITENFAMIPEASICGMFISHKDARYINLRLPQ